MFVEISVEKFRNTKLHRKIRNNLHFIHVHDSRTLMRER